MGAQRKSSTHGLEENFKDEFENLSKRDQEQDFIAHASIGDTDRVAAILKFSDLDKDCTDEKGRTALRLALRKKHTPVVEILLEVSSAENIYNALLLSIDQDNEDVSELIINHKTYRNYSKERQKEIERGIDNDVEQDETLFSQDITPLMLAAQKEQTHIVQLLLELDERIEEPHKYDCPCKDCKVVDTGESLKTARARLNAYRGLCSKAYILQTCKDPILRAFDLCDRTRWLSSQEKHFKKEYKQLQEQLGELVTRLIDRVRTEHELDQLIQGAQKEDSGAEEGNEIKKFTRLNLALSREQKSFVTHAYCQRKLMSLWYGNQDIQNKGQSLWLTLAKSFVLMLLYPFLAVIYWIMPDSRVGKQISAPIIKFTATVYSYLVFVGLIVTFSLIRTPSAGVTLSEHPTIGPHYREFAGKSLSDDNYGALRSFDIHKSRRLLNVDAVETDDDNHIMIVSVGDNVFATDENFTDFDENATTAVSSTTVSSTTTTSWNDTGSDDFPDFVIRYHSVDVLTLVICIWILGFLVHDVVEVCTKSFRYYLASYFNIMDICLLTFYITSFILRFVTIAKIQNAVHYLSTPEAWQNLTIDDVQTTAESEVSGHLYWIKADRYYWDTYDPLVFSEAFFAAANILTICRLAGLLIVNEAMGPLVISLGRMIDDIARFMVLFGLVFFAYIIGFINLYWYYFPDTRKQVEIDEHDFVVNAGDAFGDIEETFTTAFWALFGMVETESVEIGEGYAISEVTNKIGYVFFGVYCVMSVIVFINILIAMMASSFEHVVESEDMEWKFARTTIYIDFIHGGHALPVPLNLVPTPKAVYRFFRYNLFGRCCGQKKSNRSQSPGNIIESSKESPSTSQNGSEDLSNSESGISSDQEDPTTRSSFKNPKLFIQNSLSFEDDNQDEEFQEYKKQVNIYSSPEDVQELWRIRGQLKPEAEPSPAYSAVMQRLVNRYFNLGQTSDDLEQDSDGANTEKLIQDVDSLRAEVRRTTVKMEKNLSTMGQDTQSHLGELGQMGKLTKSRLEKVEQRCTDVLEECSHVSQQCTVVSEQCQHVSLQCEVIMKTLNQVVSQMGVLSKDSAELKTIASKPVLIPRFQIPKDLPPKIKPERATDFEDEASTSDGRASPTSYELPDDLADQASTSDVNEIPQEAELDAQGGLAGDEPSIPTPEATLMNIKYL